MPRTALTIGSFDGVHAGHAALLRRARALAGGDGRVIALAFDPHPSRVLRPGHEPARLTTFPQRAGLLRRAGADEVRRLEPDAALLSLTPEAFMRHVVDAFKPDVLVEGPDFRFGRGRSGDIAELRTLGGRMGFAVDVVPPAEVALADQSIVTASSSVTRWLLARGRVNDAAAILGRPHEIAGPVVQGDRRGRTIGFPTANIVPDQATPAPGVYACAAVLPSGDRHPAAVHIGERPTFADGQPRVEAHLLGLPTSADARPPVGPTASPTPWATIPGLDETGWTLRLLLHSWLRDPVRFASIDALRAQLARDCSRTIDLIHARPLQETPA